MSKSIKIDDKVYQDLDDYRAKGETFSRALEKLIHSAHLVRQAREALGNILVMHEPFAAQHGAEKSAMDQSQDPEARGEN